MAKKTPPSLDELEAREQTLVAELLEFQEGADPELVGTTVKLCNLQIILWSTRQAIAMLNGSAPKVATDAARIAQGFMAELSRATKASIHDRILKLEAAEAERGALTGRMSGLKLLKGGAG